jgi:hypothetical protein
MDSPHSVLSFDVGLRNLAIAHVRPSGVAVPPELQAFACPDEPLDDFRARGFAWFVRHGWALQRWEVVDVSTALERDAPVKNVKRLSDATKAMAIVACLRGIEASWFPAGGSDAGAGAPTVIAVEAQHNANAIMRGVAMGLMVHLHRSYPAAALTLMSGGQKLKVCTALGVELGQGTLALATARTTKATKAAAKAAEREAKAAARAAAKEAKAAAKAAKTGPRRAMHAFLAGAGAGAGDASVLAAAPVLAAPPAPPAPPARLGGYRRNLPRQGKARDKYDDNKQRAILAVRVLFPDGHPVLAAHPDKQDDLCDSLLMGIMALWDVSAWKTPRRLGRKRTVPVTKTDLGGPIPKAAKS